MNHKRFNLNNTTIAARCTECGKLSYSTRRTAHKAAKKAESSERRTRDRQPRPWNEYRCPHGNGFHVGHKPVWVAHRRRTA